MPWFSQYKNTINWVPQSISNGDHLASDIRHLPKKSSALQLYLAYTYWISQRNKALICIFSPHLHIFITSM